MEDKLKTLKELSVSVVQCKQVCVPEGEVPLDGCPRGRCPLDGCPRGRCPLDGCA